MRKTARRLAIVPIVWTAVVLGPGAHAASPAEVRLDPGAMFAGPAGEISPLVAPVLGSDAGSGEFGDLEDWVWGFRLTPALYLGAAAARLDWRKSKVHFDTGDFKLDTGTGAEVTFGWRANKVVSFELAVSYFPGLYPKPDEGETSPFGSKKKDGWAGDLSVLFHYPLWRFLPYAGAGAGVLEMPKKDGTDTGFTPFAQGGLRFFVIDYLAIAIDVKYLWGFVKDADVHTLDAFLWSVGIQLNLPFGG